MIALAIAYASLATWLYLLLLRSFFWLGTERDANQPDYLYVRGRICERQGKLDEALADFARTVAIDPKESDAYFEMGQIYERQGKADDAKTHLQQAFDRKANTLPGEHLPDPTMAGRSPFAGSASVDSASSPGYSSSSPGFTSPADSAFSSDSASDGTSARRVRPGSVRGRPRLRPVRWPRT